MQLAAMLKHSQPGDGVQRFAGRSGADHLGAAAAAAWRARRDSVSHSGRSRGRRFRSRAWSNSKSRRRSERLEVDADSFRGDYLQEIAAFRETYRRECFQSGIDYVPLDTSMPFDRALTEYLVMRRVAGLSCRE